MYNEEDLLMISGLQHFSFCRRQWALIHIEQQWKDNYLTVDGDFFHHNADNGSLFEKRGNILITRGMRVNSYSLGVTGICDIVEFHKTDLNGITLNHTDGKWIPYPIEYKRGKDKSNDCDILQLCCQAMCLEEMLACNIEEGCLFYGETRRRQKIEFTEELRNKVKNYLYEMHNYYEKGYTPKVKKNKSCNSCSLIDICLPNLSKVISTKKYIESMLGEE